MPNQKQNPNWPPKGEVQSEQIYNQSAMTFQPEEILEAIADFDKAVPKKYQGLLVVLNEKIS
jgi:hypothetical protein